MCFTAGHQPWKHQLNVHITSLLRVTSNRLQTLAWSTLSRISDVGCLAYRIELDLVNYSSCVLHSQRSDVCSHYWSTSTGRKQTLQRQRVWTSRDCLRSTLLQHDTQWVKNEGSNWNASSCTTLDPNLLLGSPHRSKQKPTLQSQPQTSALDTSRKRILPDRCHLSLIDLYFILLFY